MALYSLAQRTQFQFGDFPLWEIIPPATQKVLVREVGVILAASGTPANLAWARSNAIGLNPQTPQLAQPEEADSAPAKTTHAIGWVTPPGLSAYWRRYNAPGNIGAGVIWTFPRGFALLNVSGTGSGLVWNIATGAPPCDVWATVDE
jgi:hypothetical protein